MKVVSVQPRWKRWLSGLIWLSSMILHRHTDKWGSNLCSLTQLIIQPCKKPVKVRRSKQLKLWEVLHITGAATWTWNNVTVPSRTPVPRPACVDSWGGSGHLGSRTFSPGEYRAGRGGRMWLNTCSTALWMKLLMTSFNNENIRIRQNIPWMIVTTTFEFLEIIITYLLS